MKKDHCKSFCKLNATRKCNWICVILSPRVKRTIKVTLKPIFLNCLQRRKVYTIRRQIFFFFFFINGCSALTFELVLRFFFSLEKSCFFVVPMDVLLNGFSISAKKEMQSRCCMMGKRCHFDVTFWLLMVGDSLIEYRKKLN